MKNKKNKKMKIIFKKLNRDEQQACKTARGPIIRVYKK